MTTKLDYIVRSLSKGETKKYETYVINAIWQKLNNPNIEFVTQQYVKTKDGRKYIDMYFPQIKVAVEIDESYHNSKKQTRLDKERMKNIRVALLSSIMFDKYEAIEPIRIKIEENGRQLSIEEIDSKIDDAVKAILTRYQENSSPIWIYEQETRLKEIMSRGELIRGDCIDNMVSIMKLFGKEYKMCRRCYYKVEGGYVWSPTLSLDGSDHCGWVNLISDDLTTIYEAKKDQEIKTEHDANGDKENETKRFVFLKFTDVLGNKSRRFLGVYKANGFDKERKSKIWTLVCDKASLGTKAQ